MIASPPPLLDEEESVRPTHVEINLDCLTSNLDAIQKHVGQSKVMPILKANAYGHGIVRVAQHLVQQPGVEYLGVAFLEEGIALRNQGITTPILILGSIIARQIPLFIKHRLSLTAPSVEKLRLINDAAAALETQAYVHLKIDTGMERIGVHSYNADTLLEASLGCSHVTVQGVFSHFANADSTDLSSARLQLERFLEALSFYEKRSLPTPMRHIANSAGVLQLPESHLDLVRPGILLYGVYPSDECMQTIPVSPALSWKSRVAYFKVVQPGHPVSYGSTWQSDHPVRVITIPAGYGDGYFRALSNKSEVIVHGSRYPVVGRVCMDQMMVNLEQGTAYNGDEVTLLGRADGHEITASELAAWAGTIPYEILTNINSRVPRLYRGGANVG